MPVVALTAALMLSPLPHSAMAQAPVTSPATPPADEAPQSTDPDSIGALIGAWEISNADHDQICAVTFKRDPGAAGGMKLDFNRADCAAKFPPLKEVVAWTLNDDTVKLNDSKGKPLYEFTEVENGMYESLRAGQPLTFLQSAAAAADVVRNVSQMTGDWGIVRGSGDPVCIITLLNAPAAVVGDLVVSVKPGCDKGIAGFGFAGWQMDKNELVLKSSTSRIWRFEENNGIWQRVPEGADGIMMVKQ